MFKAINFIRSQLTNYNTKSKKKKKFLNLNAIHTAKTSNALVKKKNLFYHQLVTYATIERYAMRSNFVMDVKLSKKKFRT